MTWHNDIEQHARLFKVSASSSVAEVLARREIQDNLDLTSRKRGFPPLGWYFQ